VRALDLDDHAMFFIAPRHLGPPSGQKWHAPLPRSLVLSSKLAACSVVAR